MASTLSLRRESMAPAERKGRRIRGMALGGAHGPLCLSVRLKLSKLESRQPTTAAPLASSRPPVHAQDVLPGSTSPTLSAYSPPCKAARKPLRFPDPFCTPSHELCFPGHARCRSCCHQCLPGSGPDCGFQRLGPQLQERPYVPLYGMEAGCLPFIAPPRLTQRALPRVAPGPTEKKAAKEAEKEARRAAKTQAPVKEKTTGGAAKAPKAKPVKEKVIEELQATTPKGEKKSASLLCGPARLSLSGPFASVRPGPEADHELCPIVVR